MQSGDTIAAISSPPAISARIIVRLSGPESAAITSQFITPNSIRPGASRIDIRLGDILLPASSYLFPAPHSYTGEEMVELHIPGNPLLAKRLLGEFLSRGARSAEAGEFTARAYFAGRLDLTEAEGVVAAIHAQGDAELHAARQLLAGELSKRIAPVTESVVRMLALVEAGIDFSEEGISFLSADEIRDQIDRTNEVLDRLVRESVRFERLAHEPVVVLAGRPNAGKSTLLNALAGQERAVVSPIAGTTRDAIWASVTLPHGIVRITDVAGLGGPSVSDSQNPVIESEMQRRALSAMESADVLVLVVDAADPLPPSIPRTPHLIVRSKIDLLPDRSREPSDEGRLPLSAHSGEGMEAFGSALDRLCFGGSPAGATIALNARHLAAVAEARAALDRARPGAAEGHELLAAELRAALDALGQITGQVTPDDLLDRIFSTFCIGK